MKQGKIIRQGGMGVLLVSVLAKMEVSMASIEYIYKQYGQFNTFVSVCFIPGSDSYNKFGETIYGTFRYTLDERKRLETAIKQDPMPSTDGKVLFELSPVSPKLTDNLITELDRDGFLVSDIDSILSIPIPRRNRFAETGIKKIENILPIEFDINVRETLACCLGLYTHLYERGQVKHLWQHIEFAALVTYLHPEDVEGWVAELCDNPKLKPAIRHKVLQYKRDDVGLTKEESDECLYLSLCRVQKRLEVAQNEVKHSGVQYRNLPASLKTAYFDFMMRFETRSISMGDPIIWIDFERAFHIVVRHANGLQATGYFEDKTKLSYEFKDLFQLIHMVIESHGDEIREELKANPEKGVRRMGKRAIEYNGNYYRLEIDGKGRVFTFHPLN